MTTASFKDYFSELAKGYAKFRPHYPDALFEYLATLTDERNVAWDCATGNGQVALSLTDYFQQIYATDASQKQIAQAFQHERIDYRVAPAEHTDLADHSVDLVTVGQALHWFNLEQFYQEVRRVAKPTGVLAVWCYGFFEAPDVSESVERALKEFFDLVEPFWTPERDLVNQLYQTVPFPFDEVTAPTFEMTSHWTVDHIIGYLSTWSAVHLFSQERGVEAIATAFDNLRNVWGDPQITQRIQWRIYPRIGRM
jgi:ubiquinone/menaquinone biosynthesis C-methylase UbiE